MPGIVGFITKKAHQEAEQELRRMVASMAHEPSYSVGTWIDESLGVYVGWAARKGSFSDGMPLQNEREDVCLVFSGEEYPEPGTARRLKEAGYSLEGKGPSYLVHVYEEDVSFPAGLNGRFHGLLTDRKRGTACIFNDRYGMHRLYYHEAKDTFYFAAEAKAILAVRNELRRADPRGLGEFLSCGCVLENRTIFEGVHVLPPGSAWLFGQDRTPRKNVYFQPREWEEQTPLDPETYYRQLQDTFSSNLPRYFNGREAVGMSLTGGLDSRMIMAWQKCPPGSLPCYSFGGTFRECQDVIMARRVAGACGQPYEVIPVGEEFLARFPHYAERTVFLTDGCADVSHSPDLYVNERVRDIAAVRMTGNYGGEVLRGVRAFKPGDVSPDFYRPELRHHIHAAGATYAAAAMQTHPLSFIVFKQAPWHHYNLLALEQTQVSLRTPYLDNDLVRTVFRAPQSVQLNNDVCLRLISNGDAALRRIRTDHGIAGNEGRVSSAVTKGVLKFTFKAEYAYNDGMPQWMARADHLFTPLHLERLFLGWHKFTHFRVWYRNALAEYVREILLDPRTLSRPYLAPKALESAVQGHLKGTRNYTGAIHKLLTLELLHRLFLDPQ